MRNPDSQLSIRFISEKTCANVRFPILNKHTDILLSEKHKCRLDKVFAKSRFCELFVKCIRFSSIKDTTDHNN